MGDGQIIHPKHRDRTNEYKDLLATGSYSVIFIVVALIVIRPLMVNQILSRADAYSAFGLYDDSKRQCDKALLIDSDNSRAWRSLGRTHKAQGHLELACEAYRKATAADPANMPAHFELGLMYAADARYREAIPCFDQVRKLESERAGQPLRGRFAYHRAALDMLLLCYDKTDTPDKVEFTRKEIGVFYPHDNPPQETDSPADRPPEH